MHDLNISGSGVITGGQYSNVKISGMGKILEEITCENLDVSGISNVYEKVICNNEFKVSGISKLASEVKTKLLNISGICNFYGRDNNHLTAENIKVSGIIKNVNIINCDEIKCSGVIETKYLNADKLNITGNIKVTESINCDIVNIDSNKPVKIKEIVGSQITVNLTAADYFNLNQIWLKIKKSKHQIDMINGDTIYIDHSKVDTVSGNKIVIGPRCKVKVLEYIDSYEIDPSSKVGKIIKIEV